MICYNHTDKQAHGICKNCQKGICENCSTDLGDGLACSATCIEEVKVLNEMIKKNTKVFKEHGSFRYGSSLIFTGMGSLMILGSLLYFKRLDPFLLGMGLLLLGYGIYVFVKLRQIDKPEADF